MYMYVYNCMIEHMHIYAYANAYGSLLWSIFIYEYTDIYTPQQFTNGIIYTHIFNHIYIYAYACI
jgi:hypothetical protein